MDSPIASNIFGIAGLIIWSLELLPQIRLNYIRKSTEGVSLLCFSSWYLSGIVLDPYLVFTKKSPALIVQISIFTFLTLIILYQHFYFDRKIALKKIIISFVIVMSLSILVTTGIYKIFENFSEYEFTISLVVTILSSLFMLGGFLPQVYEIYSTKNGEAISKVFICMDFSGGCCAILSLAFMVPFDWMSFATYIIVPVFEFIQFWLIIYYSSVVKTGKVEYIDDDAYEPQQPRKLSLWKRTHRRRTIANTDKTNIEMGNKNTPTPEA
ncbi:hypothetical protein DLAC_07981 [Tieghemostelium lacteum]|uniref:PQ-loop repeat-containing protein n=1 Tax=Tieghemostelium lacteum TaxID=361077 RepID=A0A151ZAX1_TIELA|nr:hypothetical protein DLAC_07981 [Tieghemostelium lacteum]|eukprot:KYQ91078.1 hypothetical protein DLAC_07981 [Tieghemostelium lacteum]